MEELHFDGEQADKVFETIDNLGIETVEEEFNTAVAEGPGPDELPEEADFSDLDDIEEISEDELNSTDAGAIVRLSDRIAYVNHDTDDAVRAGIMREEDIPASVREVIGTSFGERIDTVIRDVAASSDTEIRMSLPVAWAMDEFRSFMFEAVYRNPRAKSEESKVEGILSALFEYYSAEADRLPPDFRQVAEEEGLARAACDYIAGMTDQFAVHSYTEIFIPGGWSIR